MPSGPVSVATAEWCGGWLAFVLTAVCTLMNFGALGRLIAAILAGHAGSGKTLLTHNRRRIISGRNGLRKSAIFVCHCGLDQSPHHIGTSRPCCTSRQNQPWNVPLPHKADIADQVGLA